MGLAIITFIFWAAMFSNGYAQQMLEHSERSISETYLSLGVFFFGLFILCFEILFMIKMRRGWGSSAIRIVGFTLVIVAGLFLNHHIVFTGSDRSNDRLTRNSCKIFTCKNNI